MNEPMELATRATSKSRTTVDSKAITSSLAQDVEPGDASEDASASNMAQQADTDAQDMRRMGRSQQFNRTFRQASITSFVALATASWEIGLFVVSPALVNGGRAGLVWSLLWNWVGFLPIYLSMAEMASMAPIAGAQYHWVSEFAPENCQKFLSYITGWISTIAWQAGNAMGVFLAGSVVQVIILVNNENYAAPAYHGALLAIGIAALAYVITIYTSRAIPYWQNAFFLLHVLAYFAYIIPIWVSAPTASHSQVWTSLNNEGGWPSMTLAVLVGQLTAVSAQVGMDTTAHMSEEVKNAGRVIPITMLSVYVINFVLLFPAILTVCYHIPDLDTALADPTTYPSIYVMRQALSTTWLTVILTVIVLILTVSAINYFAAVTRDLFAFARDHGVPLSSWLSKMHPRKRLPVNASKVSFLIAALLSLIYIGSPVAFYAITSLSTVSLLMCYILSIGSILWRRINAPHTLPPAQFELGKPWGVICNSVAVVYGTWACFWSFWPSSTPVTAAGFNWASPIFGSALVFSLVYYWVRGRKSYSGPVKRVQGR